MANLLAMTKKYISNLLLNGIIILSTLIQSHPLYILYLCYFTPYILKILYFIYPLFITTSLLLISIVAAISPGLINDTFVGTNPLLSAYDAVSKVLQFKNDDEEEDCHSLEALQIYNIVFDTSMLDGQGTNVEYPEGKILETVESSVLKISKTDEQDCFVKTEEAFKVDNVSEQDSSTEDNQFQNIKSVIRKFEGFLKKPEEPEFIEIKKVQVEINQTFEKQDTEQVVKVVHNGNSRGDSHARTSINHTENGSGFTSNDEIYRQPRSDLARNGSMRKEREWRSTLACKLFEEKHNSTNIDGIEGMDLLWEKYDEGESVNQNTNKETKKISSSKFKNKKHEYVEDEDEDEDEDVGVHLCCLQAFKLSATKMNLGVGRRNLAKISKAVKGLGWIHKASKHSKKVHNNNGETLRFP